MKRGEVYYANLEPTVGSEQGGIRPVVIIQNDVGNTYSPSVIVAPMTTAYKKPIPTHVQVGKTDQLNPNTLILAEQIRTIDKNRIGRYVCLLHKETMWNLDEALKISIDLIKKEGERVEDFKIFESTKFGRIRAKIRRDEKAWFVAKDVATALGLQKARDAVDQYVEKKNQGIVKCVFPEGEKDFAVINEIGVWSLVLGVNTESSHDFQKWISLDIIPALMGRSEKKMNDIQIFNSRELGFQVRTILNDDGSISVNAEDTARGFGWTTVAKSGNEVVRWARVNEYCREMGFSLQIGKADYIPESLFYRLGMKANNAVADKFQNWLAMEVIPAIRKNGVYGKKRLSPEEMMRIQLGMYDKHEERISESEERITKLENTMSIDYGQQRILEKEVAKVVISALGGKDSSAYKEMSKKVFSECNRDVKDYFHVNSRNNISRVRFEEAVEYIKNWTPCSNTRAAIRCYKG